MNLLAPLLSTATLSIHDYRLIPLLVALGFRLGILPEPPPAFAFAGSLPTLAATAGLAALGLATRGKPRTPRLRRLERSAGVPIAAAALLAAGSATAANAGLEGRLLGASASPADWADPAAYSALDLLVLGLISVIAVPFALMGKLQREFLAHLPLPRPRVLQATAATGGLVAAAVIGRLPVPVQLGLLLLAFVLAVALGAAIIHRAGQLLRWFSRTGQVSPRQKGLVLTELTLPGLGLLLAGSPAGVLRLLVGVLLVLTLPFAGIAVLPLYAYVGLGGALQLARNLPARRTTAIDPDLVVPAQRRQLPASSLADDW